MSMKYEDKRAEIRAYLEQTPFPGKKIPSEKELAARFDMNLGMVREVLRELETLGIIRKHKRQGNFLNTSVLKTRARLDDNCSFLALIQEQGFIVRESKRLRRAPLTLHDAQACQMLSCRRREDLICLEEIYFASEHPAILSFFYCPAAYFGPVDWEKIQNDTDALKAQIAEKTYPYFDHSVIHLTPAIAGREVGEKLNLAAGAPVLLWEESYYNIYDELTEVSYNYLNPAYMDMAFVRKRPISMAVQED